MQSLMPTYPVASESSETKRSLYIPSLLPTIALWENCRACIYPWRSLPCQYRPVPTAHHPRRWIEHDAFDFARGSIGAERLYSGKQLRNRSGLPAT